MKEKPIILIVDDEKDFTDNLVKIVGQELKEYNVIGAYNGRAALDIVKRNRRVGGLLPNKVRLVILDIKMPELDGLKFLEILRKDFRRNKIGVIMLTAWEDEEKWAGARKGKASGYLVKPVRSEALVAEIKRFFAGGEQWMVEQTKWETLIRENKIRVEGQKGK